MIGRKGDEHSIARFSECSLDRINLFGPKKSENIFDTFFSYVVEALGIRVCSLGIGDRGKKKQNTRSRTMDIVSFRRRAISFRRSFFRSVCNESWINTIIETAEYFLEKVRNNQQREIFRVPRNDVDNNFHR